MDNLSGLTFPANGTKVFQEDWNFEQESKAEEIINTRKDSFTPGIVSGGEISVGITNTINIQPIIAYDTDGKRIVSPLISNLAIPINSAYTVVIRHKFDLQTVIQPDATTLTYRLNSYEILFRTGSLSSGDIALFTVTNSSTVTTIGSDLREFRKVIDSSLVTKTNIGESFLGLVQGRLSYETAITKIYLPKWNLYEVNGKFIQLKSKLELDFSLTSNIFRADGNAIASIVEIQNKHLYLLLSDSGVVSAQIIDNSELSIGSHSYLDNVKLIEDYYKPSPLIFNSSKNGFYKSSKRIIAVLRISNSNSIEFWYELGFGHRFQDVEHLSVGQKFVEIRWKREHPNCYYPNGDTISTMSSESPLLHRILGTNVLPDWRDRFGRNIDLASGRAIRDTQGFAMQGHIHNIASVTAGTTGPELWRISGGSGGALYSGINDETGGPVTDGTNGTPQIANEVRPSNFAELVQIVRG